MSGRCRTSSPIFTSGRFPRRRAGGVVLARGLRHGGDRHDEQGLSAGPALADLAGDVLRLGRLERDADRVYVGARLHRHLPRQVDGGGLVLGATVDLVAVLTNTL